MYDRSQQNVESYTKHLCFVSAVFGINTEHLLGGFLYQD